MKKTVRIRGAVPRLAASAAVVVLAAGLMAVPASAAPQSLPGFAGQAGGAPVAGLNLLLRADPWKVVQTRRAPDRSWDQAKEIPQFANLLYFSLVDDGGRLRMFGARGTMGGKQYVQSAQQPDGSWSDVTPMAGLAVRPDSQSYGQPGRITAAKVAGRIQVAAIDGTGTVVHTVEQPDGSWQPWGVVNAVWGTGSGQFFSLSVTELNGELQMVGLTRAGEVVHTIRHADGWWSAWGDVMGQTGTPSPWGLPIDVSAVGVNGALQVAVVDNSQTGMYHAIRYPDGYWSRWGDIGSQVHFNRAGFLGFMMGGVDGAAVNGEFQLVFESSDNRGSLYHTIRHANGTWDQAGLVQSAVDLSAWRPVAGGSAAAG